jgi:uncharacterized protein YbjT (DUF2867 family)
MILVTGATGNVGSQVVERLLSHGRSVRVFTRDTAKVARWGDQVQAVAGNFTEPETFAQAVVGVEAVFMMNGALDGGLFRQLMAIAKEQGSPRVVFLSSLFAADPALAIGRLHKDKEDVLLASGLEAAVVRAGSFMSNAYQWIGTIQSDGTVYNAVGEGVTAPVDPEDIAAVVVHALTTPQLIQTFFDVTGATRLTIPQQVEILAKALARPLRTVEVPAEAAVQGLVSNGVPPHVATALGESFTAIREGRAAAVTDTVERVTGRNPRSFAEWAQEHAARFA